MSGKDPYRYFRVEARELAESLGRDALELERGGDPRPIVPRMLRNAHTLKGASRVVRLPAVGDIAHALEGLLEPYRNPGDGRDPGGAVPADVADRLLGLLDDLAARLAEIDAPDRAAAGPEAAGPGPAAETPAAARADRRWDTVRLEIAEVDVVLGKMSEATAELARLRREMDRLDRARRLAGSLSERSVGRADSRQAAAEELGALLDRFRRAAGEALDRAESGLRESHERAERLRLVPAGALFDFLARAVRDAARSQGKAARLEASGGRHRLDAPVLAALQEALLHLVRNAVAHGIEDPEARRRAGKPAEGEVRIEVARRGGRVVIACADDGRGIDPAAVRRRAAERGMLPPAAPDPLSLAEAVDLLLRGSVSTAESVSDLAGRGIGLDAVRAAVAGLGGDLRVDSRPGAGTRVEIEAPYSLSTFPALALEADGEIVLLPFDSVRRAVRVRDAEVARSPGGGSLSVDGVALPLLPLEGVLPGGRERSRPVRPGVVVEAAAGAALVCADRILGVREAVARPLPPLAAADPVVAGASLDVEGNPCLVLDPAGLVRAALGRRGLAPAAGAAPKPPILVVDDSLTTRMLERTILESAGYEVDCAVSAEEALAMVGRRRYGLFLVDVEMPGMDGFALLERFRGDPDLRGVPAILVTSRDSREDRERAAAAGARDHIAKGEFDQARLLGRIRELVG